MCDLAETYHIYDIKALSPVVVATLVAGLRPDSRTVMAENGIKDTNRLLILASISDTLRWLQWAKTKNGSKNRNKPKYLMPEIFSKKEVQMSKGHKSFDSGEDFDAHWEKIRRKEEARGK